MSTPTVHDPTASPEAAAIVTDLAHLRRDAASRGLDWSRLLEQAAALDDDLPIPYLPADQEPQARMHVDGDGHENPAAAADRYADACERLSTICARISVISRSIDYTDRGALLEIEKLAAEASDIAADADPINWPVRR